MRTNKFAVIALLLVGGCAVGPDYEAPQIKTTETFIGSQDPTFAQSAVGVDWWRGFSDPILDELVANALKENWTLQAAVARVNQARALQQQALLNLFPIVTASGGLTNQRFSNQGAFGGVSGVTTGGTSGSGGTVTTPTTPTSSRGRQVSFYDAGFDASWEIDVFGRVRRGLEQESADSEAAVADVEDAVRSLVSEVARTYFELRGYQALAAVARDNAKVQDQVVHVSDSLFKGGQTTEFDVMRAKSLWATTMASIPALEASIRTSMYRLAVLLGQQPQALMAKLETNTGFPKFTGPVQLGDPASLIQRRPDVRAAERRLAAATAGIGVAKGDYFPKVTFGGTFSLQSRRFSDLTGHPGESWNFGPRISWAALDIFRVVAKVDASQAIEQEALAQYQQAVLVALEDVEGALVRFSAVRERRDYLHESVDLSQKAVAIARTQYENGLVDLLPVLDAQRTVLQSQDQLTRSETDLLTSLVAVYKALSGGWDGVVLDKQDAEVVTQDAPLQTPDAQSTATIQPVVAEGSVVQPVSGS